MDSLDTQGKMQETVNQWIEAYGVRYFDPMTNMAILTEEMGEVARAMARLYGEQSAKEGEEISRERLADELSDLMWVDPLHRQSDWLRPSPLPFKANIEKGC